MSANPYPVAKLKRVKGVSDPKLFAVVSLNEAPRPAAHKPNITELKTTKLGEFKLKSKIDKAAGCLDRLENQVAELKKIEASLKRRIATKLDRIARIENGVIAEMEKAALQKCDGWQRVFRLRSGPPACTVDDEKLIPAQWKFEELVTRPEKNRIKAALALGFEVTDAAAVPVPYAIKGALNNAAIKAALEAGLPIPGVALLESIPGVRITAKAVLSRE